MNTSTRAFVYGITQSIGDTAIAYALTAARWGVLGYSALTSPEALRRYRVAGQYLRATCLFFYGLGIISRRAVQCWVDAQIEGATPKALPPAAEPVEVEVVAVAPVAAVAAAVAAPVAVARIELPATDWQAMTSQELRKECSRLGITWRNARPDGKHLRKEEMLKALA